ncbi:hypothetical protein K458DRAFT_349788, partial [Lentithecium fluviatile CBS 122367]
MPTETPPAPAYFPTTPTSVLHPPTSLYTKLKSLRSETGELVKTMEFTIPPRSGRAWQVPAACIFRLSTPAGPQVGDLNVWALGNPRERFWAARTRQLQGSHVKEGDRLWSCLPYMRPLCGVLADGCEIRDAAPAEAEGGNGGGGNGKGMGREAKRDERGGVTRWGGRCHDLLGTRCDPYVSHMLTGDSYDYHCHSNLVRAILPYGLTEFDVHDVLNVFQVTGLDSQGRYFMESSPATPSSYLTFFAETSLLCALSTCPGGDLSAWGWHQADEGADAGDLAEGVAVSDGEKKPDMKSTCRPIKVEVFEIAEHVKRGVLKDWKESSVSGYKGMHGMRVPLGEE